MWSGAEHNGSPNIQRIRAMTDVSLKKFSLEQIEASVAKALSELSGQDVKVTINSIEHPPLSTAAALMSGEGTWQASFVVKANYDPESIGPDVPF